MPLHYAARFGHVQRAKQLLQLDKYIAYVIADKDDKKTTLHVAATHGHVGVMKELIAKDTISTENFDLDQAVSMESSSSSTIPPNLAMLTSFYIEKVIHKFNEQDP
ncbi:receptor-interacting serine/threonine-protein kinase 4-like [Camellia sinensis]|uniref:receptor-interacting serine/threonine-protein kinase 4-like n=1 Tax=Camellia sinensis TaxID=4442 RepID=UPI0010361530|nr:receptor-interacting serine/threonine-protein kinase 4-like [Camellia sinensis]